MDKQTLIEKLIAIDNGRARSMQTAIGVSQLGGCRRAVWHKLQGHKGTNSTLRMASIMGTAIHAAIEAAFANSGALIEKRVEIDGLPPATIDYFDPTTGEVVDWKTIKLSGVPYFISKQKRWQVQTYGYLLSQAGYEVKTVTLVGIPRDGNEDDIVVYSEPYDESIGLEALAWLDEVKAMTEAPAPERDAASFCKSYCSFYGSLCNGIPKDLGGEPIFDEAAALAAKNYKQASADIKEAEARKDAAKEALLGVSGITMDGIKVSWSETKGRETPDADAIQKLLGDTPIPTKLGAPSTRLMVK